MNVCAGVGGVNVRCTVVIYRTIGRIEKFYNQAMNMEANQKKCGIVIPTYWTSAKEGNRKGYVCELKCVYDHPTSLDGTGTLHRTLDSLLKQQEIQCTVIVTVSVMDASVVRDAREKVEQIVAPYRKHLEVIVFGNEKLEQIYSCCEGMLSREELQDLLSLDGYSNIRNVGLFLAVALGLDAIVTLDDDEEVIGEDFLQRAFEHIGMGYDGKFVGGITGYYIDEVNQHHLHPISWRRRIYDLGWNKLVWMNKAFRLIDAEERLQRTPFALGGASVLHRKMFVQVPYDPWIVRGEDIDLVLNARLFGFEFLLDNSLAIYHIKTGVTKKRAWSILRQDILRFDYMRTKVKCMKRKDILPNFMPYPGHFLVRNRTTGFILANLLHILFFPNDTRHYLQNIVVALIRSKKLALEHCNHYQTFQKKWKYLMNRVVGDTHIHTIIAGTAC